MDGSANECIPFYEDGDRVTGHCKEAVTGKRFVKIADDIQSGPGLSATGDGGNVVIQHADAKGFAIGVTSHDAAKDEKVTVLRGTMVVPVTAAEAINAGEAVAVAAGGKVAKAAEDSEVVGRVWADVAEGKDAMVALDV